MMKSAGRCAAALVALFLGMAGVRADVDVQSAVWGTGFRTCPGASPADPLLLKAANPVDNDKIRASGLIKCADVGDAYVYTVDFINFSLNPSGGWTAAHLEWLGAAVQRPGPRGNQYIYDEVRPINVRLTSDVKRLAVTNLSFRIPKPVLAQARGFGLYVVGGGILWSIFFI